MDCCGHCEEPLTEPARLLPCLHSACQQCIQSRLTNLVIESGTENGKNTTQDLPEQLVVCCPYCESQAGLPQGDMRSLPVDPRTQNSLLQRCQLCSITPALAFCKCEECALLMCGLCAETHIKFGDIGGHSILHLQDTRVRNSPREQRWCVRHPLEEVAYFCWDCRCGVCSECCRGHRLEDTTGAAHKLTSFITEGVTAANTALRNVIGATNSNVALTTAINEQCDAITKEVEQFIEGYKEALDAHRSALLANVEQVRESRTDIAKESMDRLERWISTTNHILQFAGYLSASASSSQVVSIGGWTLDRLGEVASSSTFLRQPNVSAWLQFLPDERPTNTPRYLLTGIISTQAVSPFQSSIDTTGVLNCKQHTKATFILVTRDSDNIVLTHGGEKILAEVKYKDASQRTLPVEVSDEGDGNYVISFTPDAFGSLLLSVFIHNTHVKGSPYTVTVSSTRQHKGVFHCCSFCSSGGNKNATCACGAKMPGGYRGCGHGHVGHPGRRHWSCCANVLQNSECGRPLIHQYSF